MYIKVTSFYNELYLTIPIWTLGQVFLQFNFCLKLNPNLLLSNTNSKGEQTPNGKLN